MVCKTMCHIEQSIIKCHTGSIICTLFIKEWIDNFIAVPHSRVNTFRLNIFMRLRLQHSNSFTAQDENKYFSLFVFSINGPKQNATSLLTPGSDTDFYALSCGSLHSVLHGSTKKPLISKILIGC